MKVTKVRLRPAKKDSNVLAVASVTFDDEFVVHGIKLLNGEKGLLAVKKKKKMPDGSVRDIAHPVNSDARAHLTEALQEEYLKFAVSR